ncbi:hypothetical protein [Povalibacter sp.]|uniref:hypothetical protein n=1 Tax=Povalibacter sp. TaxID=1962978 RepID=UPI002F40B88F
MTRTIRTANSNQRGNAMAETIVTLLALAPFIVGIPLLGKQLDIKHKTYDSTRYAVWERTVWRSDGASNRKSEDDITLEARDRTLGSPLAGLIDVERLRTQGITENALWRDWQRQRLLHYEDNAMPVNLTYNERPTPVDVGLFLVPGIAYGDGVVGNVQQLLQLSSLNLSRRAFASSTIAVGVRPSLGRLADHPVTLGEREAPEADRGQIVHRASGAILSDTWSSRNEDAMRRRIDDVTVNELVERFELPGRPIGLQALGKGEPLYGEGQFGWEPDLRPSSTVLPAAYIERR